MSELSKQLFDLLEVQSAVKAQSNDAKECWECVVRDYGGSKTIPPGSVVTAALLAYGSQEARACLSTEKFAQFIQLISEAQVKWSEIAQNRKPVPLAGFIVYLKREGKIV